MPVTNVTKDVTAATMTVVSEFDASVERVWQLWADPRQLERWWGPPEWPATVADHDLSPGGAVNYWMTGPDGTKAAGWWRIVSADPPNSLEFQDGFSGDSGEPNPDMPTMVMRMNLAPRPAGGTTMTVVTSFPSAEAMTQLVEMGMIEGMSSAMGQIDGILAEQS